MCDKFLIIYTNITLIKIDNTFLAKLTSVDVHCHHEKNDKITKG